MALAHMHLALTGLHAIDLDAAQRLFVSEWAMDNGVTPKQLLKLAGILRKDDDEDDDGNEDEEGNNDDSTSGGDDDSGDSDFDNKHARWPAGSPGGIGGEFAPRADVDTDTLSPSGGDNTIEMAGNIPTTIINLINGSTPDPKNLIVG